MRDVGAVLRLGHRPGRDKRMTTHVGLTARALGLKKMYMDNLDPDIKSTVEDVGDRFGGNFEVIEKENWKNQIKKWEGTTIHLTMYGDDINDFFEDVNERKIDNPLIIVGSKKVPKKVYDLVDFNVSVGNQPHSEVAALAVFLDRLNQKSLPEFPGGELDVIPDTEGKRVVNTTDVPEINTCFEFCREKGMDNGLFSHVFSVLDRALYLREKNGGNLKLIKAGALLHDIGRTKTHGIEHGVEGARMIKEKGWSDELARIAERHIGGGITKEEAMELDIPTKSYIPETLEEKIICHADNSAGGKSRFEYQLERTEEAGHEDSANRMRKLAEELNDEDVL